MTENPPAPRRASTIHVIGGVTVDLIMGQVPPWPLPGTETFVGHSELRPGGPAGNAALALKALGVAHRLVSNVGDDMFGTWLEDTFGEAGAPWKRAAQATALSVAIEHPGGERTFFTAPGNLNNQTAEGILDALPALAASGDIALLTGAFLYPALVPSFEMVLREIGRRGFAVAIDTGWPPGGWTADARNHTSGWLACSDHILLNEVECLSLSGAPTIAEAARWIAARAKLGSVLVIKRGARGASAWHDGKAFDIAAPAVDVIDTTGAGDAFNAGYLAARLRGAALAVAVEEGVELASAAIASSPRAYRPPAGRPTVSVSDSS